MRPSGRQPDQLRTIVLTPHFTKHAEGSVLVEFGRTRVLCAALRPKSWRAWLWLMNAPS